MRYMYNGIKGLKVRIQSEAVTCVDQELGSVPPVPGLHGSRNTVLARGSLALDVLPGEVPAVRHPAAGLVSWASLTPLQA